MPGRDDSQVSLTERPETIPPIEHGPVSVGARLMGDRWSLLIVRELLAGTSHFNELHRCLPGLSRSILSSRLRYLCRVGVVVCVRGEGRSAKASSYALTPAGVGMRPALEALGDWALTWHLPSEDDDRVNAQLLLWRMQQSVIKEALPNGRVTIQFLFENPEASSGWLRVGSESSSVGDGLAERDVDLTVRTRSTVMSDLWWGRRACEEAIGSGEISFEGPSDYARGFRSWFGRGTASGSRMVADPT